MAEDLDHALQALPHGEGFTFIDQLTELSAGQSASALYLVKGSEDFLAHHFPGDPMMPGVILIEAIAQLAGIAAQNAGARSFANLRLAAVRQAKILQPARPGDQLEIQVSITAAMGGLIQADGQVSLVVDGDGGKTVVTKAQITLSGGE
ncbi:MAG: beta-hydroxyacyl-ACP dehydratase [Verrucomicrobiales bacterium]|nr:beta-hydroxyacyl-ACP dehydratase [Verrucomicrobiales bacterium]